MSTSRVVKYILGIVAAGIAIGVVVALVIAGPAPERVLAASAARLDSIDSLYFTMDVVTVAEGEEVRLTAEGSAELPATVVMAGTMELGGQEVEYEQALVGKTMFMRFPPDEQWYYQSFDMSAAKGSNSLPTDYLVYWEAFSEIEDLGVEAVGGIDCRRYRLDIDESKIWDVVTDQLEEAGMPDLLADTGADLDVVREMYESSTMTIDIWIGVDDDLPRREIVDMTTESPVPATVSATLDFWGFNFPVEIPDTAGAVSMEALTQSP